MKQRLYPRDQYPQGHPELARSLDNLGYVVHSRGDSIEAVIINGTNYFTIWMNRVKIDFRVDTV